MSMERKTIIVNTMATEQPHFESSKKKKHKKIGFSLSITCISCEQGAKWMMLVCICSIDTCLKHIKKIIVCSVMSMVSMETKTEFDKPAIQTQQKLFSSINFSIIFKIKSANFPIVNYFR